MSTAKRLMHSNKSESNFPLLSKRIQSIIEDAILKTAQERNGPEGYKTDDESIEEIEFKSCDGFMAFDHNRGGLTYRNFTDLMDYFGNGHVPAHEGVAKEIQRQIDYSLESLSESVYEDHKSLCLELNIGETECQYHAIDQYIRTSDNLTDAQKTELKQMLNEIQGGEYDSLSGDDNSIMHEIRVMYHGKIGGVHTASVSAALNTEGPYHRSGISWAPGVFCEGAKEVEITWRNNAELKRKLDKALKKVSKEIF